MHVVVSAADEQLARRAAVALFPLCDLLATHTEHDECRLSLNRGVVIAEFHAKDGTRAQVAVGVTALALAITAGREQLARYADQLCSWGSRKQAEERRHRLLPYSIMGHPGASLN